MIASILRQWIVLVPLRNNLQGTACILPQMSTLHRFQLTTKTLLFIFRSLTPNPKLNEIVAAVRNLREAVQADTGLPTGDQIVNILGYVKCQKLCQHPCTSTIFTTQLIISPITINGRINKQQKYRCILGIFTVNWPITIKLRTNKQTTKPLTNYHCRLRSLVCHT